MVTAAHHGTSRAALQFDLWPERGIPHRPALVSRCGGYRRYHVEMNLPGDAWLDFQLAPTATGTRVDMRGLFDPRGLAGRAYWWGLYPAHRRIFSGMMAELARRAGARPPD